MTTASGKKGAGRKKGWLVVALAVVCSALILFGIRTVGYSSWIFQQWSMAPLYEDGDHVLVDRHAFGFFLPGMSHALFGQSYPRIGDVVLVHVDDGATVKRVVGVAGNRIAITNNVVFRNGVPLARRDLGPASTDRVEHGRGRCIRESFGAKAWTIIEDPTAVPFNFEEVTVPRDTVYLLGDNRSRSYDSRFCGPYPLAGVKGRAVRTWLPAPHPIRCDGHVAR